MPTLVDLCVIFNDSPPPPLFFSQKKEGETFKNSSFTFFSVSNICTVSSITLFSEIVWAEGIMKVLLTGATGFLGTQLLADFLRRNYQVIITKRNSTDLSPLYKRFGKLDSWNIDGDGLASIFLVHPDIDAIVHASVDYGRDDSRPTATFWANEAFPIRLLELAIQYDVGLFVNIDTFFNANKVEYAYLSAYTLSKRHFQEWGLLCATAARINFVNLRLFHLYGPGDGPHKFVPTMIKRCLAGEEIDMTDGEQKRDFIHIEDAISAIGKVLEAELDRRYGYCHFDVGTGTSLRIKDFMEMVQRICNSGAKLNFGTLPTSKGEILDSRADTKALRTLGWEARVGIEAGIQSVINDAIRRRSLGIDSLGEKAE
jgi:CDP-paratose synthetase